MNAPLRLLIVEDSPDDAALLVAALEEDGFAVQWNRVETEMAMAAALRRQPWDAVISDYRLPHFDGLAALQLLQKGGHDCPFILVSGTIGEDTAVTAMKAGAHDYLMKGFLARLAPALRRELADAEARRQRRALEAKLREEQERFRAFVEKSAEGVLLIGADGKISYASPACERLFGLQPAEITAANFVDFVHPNDAEPTRAGLAALLCRSARTWSHEIRCRRKQRQWRWFHVNATNLLDDPHLRGVVVNCRDITSRKRAEQRAHESRQRMQAILDHSPALIYMKDLAGRYVLTSRLFDTKYAGPAGSAVGKTVEEIQPKEIAEMAAVHDLEALRTNQPIAREETVRETGGLFTYHSVRFPLHNEHGNLCGLGGIELDITERKRIEGELRQRNRELALINRVIAAANTENEPESFLEVACRELALTSALPRVLVSMRDETKTKATIVAEYCAPGQPAMRGTTLPVANCPVSRLLSETKQPQIIANAATDPRLAEVADFIRQAGIASLGAWPLLVENEIAGSLIIASDKPTAFAEVATLVPNVAAEISGALGRARLNENARRLLTAIEQSPESIVITDTAARILYVNPAFERNTGYSRLEVIGQNPRLLKSGRHDADFYRKLWDTIAIGQVWQGRLVNRRKDGSLFTEDAIITPVRDAVGAITHYVATKRDISRELELEEKFYHAQRMDAFGQLAGGVAHDFNNILAVILMQLSLLQLDSNLSPKQRETLEETTRAAQRAAEVTRQLLVFSRRQAMQIQTIDLNKVVAGTVKMLHRLLGENIELVFEPGGDRQWIEADPGMVEQVIMNLCVNARDAMAGGGRVEIRTGNIEITAATARESAPPGLYVCLQVADTGCGMDTATVQRLFEPFFTTKPAGKGTGLGLATVYGIVRQHRGWVEVESAVGKGSTFRVWLPFSTQAGVGTAPPIQMTLPRGRERILLVEDDADVRRATARCLLECGYKIVEACNGVEALQLWEEEQHEFDLLLTDVTMPGGISGVQLAEQMRRAKDSLRVVMVSGHNREIRDTNSLPPFSVFLAKPVELWKLARTIRDCLDDAGTAAQPVASE
jgi:PAS domain S-box-containing protein